jgi:hypothetical protein
LIELEHFLPDKDDLALVGVDVALVLIQQVDAGVLLFALYLIRGGIEDLTRKMQDQLATFDRLATGIEEWQGRHVLEVLPVVRQQALP